jgi:hypothetical protein
MDDNTEISFTSQLEISFGFDPQAFKLRPLDHSRRPISTSSYSASASSDGYLRGRNSHYQSHSYEVKITPNFSDSNKIKSFGDLFHKNPSNGEAARAIPPNEILVTREVIVKLDSVDNVEITEPRSQLDLQPW